MVNSSEQERSLFLCVTPLQARICLKIIELEKIENFDVIYYLNSFSDSSIAYFKKLKEIANNSIILKINNGKDLFKSNFILPKPFLKKDYYKKIYLASIDLILFKKIIKNNKKTIINTFDDGTANIFENSNYFKEEYYGRSKKQILFLKIFNLPKKTEIIQKTKKHYTIFNEFKNIVPNEKLQFISIFENNKNNYYKENTVFFLGQPFHEYLDENKINKIINYLKKIKIDYYVMHPRESRPILKNINILNKKSEIAEVAIIKKSETTRPLIISAFSTVLFNINKDVADKIYLSLDDNEEEKDRINLIKKTGSKIIKLS